MANVTTVTVIVYSEDGCESGSTWMSEGDTLEKLIEDATSSALERYEEQIGALPAAHRIIIHIDEFPEPKARGTIVRSVLPEQTDDDTITATVS